MDSESENDFKSAFVALIGRPNTGKSTLLNTVLGETLSIVSSLPQTTRRTFRGIYSDENMQLIFIDTPGIHEGKHFFNKAMSHQSLAQISKDEVDLVCYMVDLSRDFGPEEDAISQTVQKSAVPTILIFNKTDLCSDSENRRRQFFERYPLLDPKAVLSLSAIQQGTRERFLSTISSIVPSGPRFFPGDELTDADLRFFAGEYIRAAIIDSTREEVPHACFVEILDYKERNGRHYVQAAIHVETTGQKGIIIGRRGALIKKIKQKAQRQHQKLTSEPVSIQCHVKVTPKWRDNKRFLSDMGLE
ncbi:MAG: GTPase Era [Chitinispirillaceae bacterium]